MELENLSENLRKLVTKKVSETLTLIRCSQHLVSHFPSHRCCNMTFSDLFVFSKEGHDISHNILFIFSIF